MNPFICQVFCKDEGCRWNVEVEGITTCARAIVEISSNSECIYSERGSE
jgi:hypothetical protein